MVKLRVLLPCTLKPHRLCANNPTGTKKRNVITNIKQICVLRLCPPLIVYADALVTVAGERFTETPATALARQISTQQGQETGYKRGVTLKGTP